MNELLFLFWGLTLLLLGIAVDRIAGRLDNINKSLRAIEVAIGVGSDNLMNRD